MARPLLRNYEEELSEVSSAPCDDCPLETGCAALGSVCLAFASYQKTGKGTMVMRVLYRGLSADYLRLQHPNMDLKECFFIG